MCRRVAGPTDLTVMTVRSYSVSNTSQQRLLPILFYLVTYRDLYYTKLSPSQTC